MTRILGTWAARFARLFRRSLRRDGRPVRAARAVVLVAVLAAGLAAASLAEADGRLGDRGDSCGRTSDCAEGLRCQALVCIDPKLGFENDSCQGTGDCNPPLVCREKKCQRGPAPATSGSATPATTTPTASAPPAPEPPPSSDAPPGVSEAGLELRRRMGGLAGTGAFGYGGLLNTKNTVSGGVTYGFHGSIGLGASVGLATYFMVTSGSGNFTFGGYMAGLRLGRRCFFDMLVGFVKLIDLELGPGLGAGCHIRIAKTDGAEIALTPHGYFATAPGKFDEYSFPMVLQATIGLTFLVPRLEWK